MKNKNYRHLLILVFILISSGIFLTAYNGSTEVSRMQPDNGFARRQEIIQSGYIGMRDDWTYYIDYQSGASGAIHRAKKDGSEDSRLVNDMVFDAKFDGDWIYYVTDLQSGNKIYKVKTDGAQRTLLVDPKIDRNNDVKGTSKTFIDIAEGTIFYSYVDAGTGRAKLYRMSRDGRVNEKLADDVLNFYVYDWNIYYKNDLDNTVYRMELHGRDRRQISRDTTCSVGQMGDYVYYKNFTTPGITKVSLDGMYKQQILYDNNVEAILNVQNGFVYYTRTGDGIYKVRIKVGRFGNKAILVKSFK